MGVRPTGKPSQPLIAERQLRRSDSGGAVRLRVYAPHACEGEDPWICGYDIIGIPELQQLPYLRRGDGEVFFAPGPDSFGALLTVWFDVRGILDLVEREFAVRFTAPGIDRFDHGVPATVFAANGREWERRLIEAMDRESERMRDENFPTALQDYYRRHGHLKPPDPPGEEPF